MKDKTWHKMKPREFIDSCRDLLGDTYLIKLFNVGQRTLQRWTAETPYVSEDSIRENWIEKELKIIVRLKKKSGGLDIARSLVSLYADGVDMRRYFENHSDTLV